MKRYLLLILILTLIQIMPLLADGTTATLQQGDKMTFFTGMSALQQAYEAASANGGDIITLSSGEFTAVTTIEKSVRIVGAYGLDPNDSYGTFIAGAVTVNADNVKLEGMYFKSNVTLAAVNNCTIKRCWINNLKQSGEHTNTLIDQCVVKYDYAIETGVNYGIKNSTLDYFAAMNTTANVANITNCLVWWFYSYDNNNDRQPYAVYKNNILILENYSSTNRTLTLSSPSEFYNNYLYRTTISSSNYSSYYVTCNFSTGCVNVGNVYSGETSKTNVTAVYPDTLSFTVEGVTVGITGGEGFNKYPGIPRVLTSTIDAQTDDKGKLNASITVQAEK